MIEKLTEADFDQMFSLMERSFPEDERRDYNGQRELLAEPAYNLYAKRSPEDAALQAFLALWELGDMVYIEHFAVDPDCRNGGLGGKILQKVIEDTDMRICLEVELYAAAYCRRTECHPAAADDYGRSAGRGGVFPDAGTFI